MSNEKKDIEAINLLHKEYFRLLSDNKLDQLKDIFFYPSIFKGFLDEIVIATKGDDLKDIYKKFHLNKINNSVIKLWSALLKKIPESKLFLKYRSLDIYFYKNSRLKKFYSISQLIISI